MRYRRLVIGAVLTATLAAPLGAHEGHKAITAKGVRIDKDGLLHLNPTARRAIGLALGKVDFGTIEEIVPLNARIMLPWDRKAFASARVEGVVKELLVKPGQKVKAGERLAVIESLPLESLRLELRQAEIGLELADKNLKRARELGETVVAGREILALEAERENRRNAAATVRKKLEAIGIDASRLLPILAPMDGIVSHLDVVIGRHIEPTEHLFKIHDLRRVWAECEVPENLVERVAVGQQVRLAVFAYPDRTFTGKIDLADFAIDEAESIRRVWVRLDNADGVLVPGMFGTAEVITRRAEDVFVAPKAGIVLDGAERYAFVEVEEGVYRKTNVVVGMTRGEQVEVLEGPYAGDKLVTAGNHELSSLFVQGSLKVSDEAAKNMGLLLEEIDIRPVERVTSVNARVITPPAHRGLATTRIDGKIERVHVVQGQAVKAGQALAEVQSLELQSAQLDLIHLDLEVGFVRKQLGFVRTLEEQKISARKELLRLESELLELETRLQSLRRALLVRGLAKAEIDRVLDTRQTLPGLTIRAPIDGRVGTIRVVVGEIVDAGEALFEVRDISKVWIQGMFFESDLAGLFEGGVSKAATVRTVAGGEREWRGKISLVNRSLDAKAGVLLAWMEVDNGDQALLPGMHAKMTITLGRSEKEVIAVPLRALLSIGSRSYAFVEQGQEFKRVEVKLGRRDAHYAEVSRGLFPGDRVVVSGVNEMNNALSAVR